MHSIRGGSADSDRLLIGFTDSNCTNHGMVRDLSGAPRKVAREVELGAYSFEDIYTQR